MPDEIKGRRSSSLPSVELHVRTSHNHRRRRGSEVAPGGPGRGRLMAGRCFQHLDGPSQLLDHRQVLRTRASHCPQRLHSEAGTVWFRSTSIRYCTFSPSGLSYKKASLKHESTRGYLSPWGRADSSGSRCSPRRRGPEGILHPVDQLEFRRRKGAGRPSSARRTFSTTCSQALMPLKSKLTRGSSQTKRKAHSAGVRLGSASSQRAWTAAGGRPPRRPPLRAP